MWWGGVVGAGVRKLLARYFITTTSAPMKDRTEGGNSMTCNLPVGERHKKTSFVSNFQIS